MSGTSTKIYGNDIAMDVKIDFDDLFGIGKSIDEIHKYIFAYQPIDGDEDCCAYWSALANIEWDYGVLDDYVKDKARDVILNNNDCHLFLGLENQKKRQIELKSLMNKLETKNAKCKKKKNPYIYHTPYKAGDILAFKMKDKYAYLHVVGIETHEHKFKELTSNGVYVQLFDILGDELLDINLFKRKFFNKINYRKLNSGKFKNSFVEHIWCLSKREQIQFESKITVLGNQSIKAKYPESACIYFQFKVLENTIYKIFLDSEF